MNPEVFDGLLRDPRQGLVEIRLEPDPGTMRRTSVELRLKRPRRARSITANAVAWAREARA